MAILIEDRFHGGLVTGVRDSRKALQAFPIPLARTRVRDYAAGMKNASIGLLAGVLAFTGCEEKKEITVTETRAATTADGGTKLLATSDERFRNTQPSPVTATLPDGWREVPGTQFRNLNYRFGENGVGETWVTVAAGTLLAKVNRWVSEFGGAPLNEDGLAKLKPVMLAGGEGVWVEAEGDYKGAMGGEPKTGYGLAGVVASVAGKIITVKMVGPKAEVDKARPELEKLVGSIRLAE